MLRSPSEVVFCVVAMAGGLGRPTEARAAPNDGYAMSNDGAMRGGAAVALGEDGASVWYNPAAVAGTQHVRFDASATAYGLQLTRVPSGMQARVGDERRDLAARANDILVVPTAATFAYAWPRHRVAIAGSFHTPVFSDGTTRMELAGRNEVGGYDYAQQANLISTTRRYHAGVTVAWAPVEAFRIGLTVGAVYASEVAFVRVASHASGEGATAAFSTIIADQDPAARVAGIEAVLGVQGRLTPWLRAGASVRAPAGRVYSAFEGGQTVSVTVREPTGEVSSTSAVERVVPQRPPVWITPWTVAVGLAVVRPRWDLEVDVEAVTSLGEAGSIWYRAALWNVRAGGTFRISERWIVGAGLFTDRTYRAHGELYPTVDVDRWGGSLALRLRSIVRLAATERAGKLVFETTLAARYAFGIGSAGVLRFDYPDEGPHAVSIDTSGTTRATQHLLTAHVGTGMRF